MLTRLYCEIDDFCQEFIPLWKQQLVSDGSKKRDRSCCLSYSEIMTIVVHFHQSGYRKFKWYYQQYVQVALKKAFPNIPSYSHFIELKPRIMMPLTLFMHSLCKPGRGLAFIDSTPLRVCQNLRIPRHKTFKKDAGRSKSSTGWFYGFKLHLVVDDCGNIVSFSITSGNTDDRKPVPTLLKNVTGKVFGDRGYISKKLAELLAFDDISFITTIKKNMTPKVISDVDKALLRKRSIIETINDQLKNVSQIEHSRHRSLSGYMINVISGLIAYTYQPKKPSLNLDYLGLVCVD